MKNILIVSLLAIFSVSCNYNRMKETTSQGPNKALTMLGRLDYATVNESVIGPRCLNCHSNGGGNQGGINLETYKNIRDQISRVAYRSLERMDMPPRGGLTGDEMTILKSWLENGAPETMADVRENGDPDLERGPTDWMKINQKIFAKKCLDCHSPPAPHGNLDLTSYNEVKNRAAVIFDRVIVKQDMPMQPYPALSPRERKVLLNWFNLGMPN